jgi:hypothetical protein
MADAKATALGLAMAWCACGVGSEVRDGPTPAADTAGEASTPGEVACDAGREGATRCAADGSLETCLSGAWVASACLALTACDGGACLPVVCAHGEARCEDARTRILCNASGTAFLAESCGEGICRDGGCVHGCTPGTRRCVGDDIVECQDDRESEALVATCDAAAGQACVGGRCLSECEATGAKRGYLACDFWAADLPINATGIDNVFAFAFSNGSPRVATVTVTHPWGEVATVSVPVGGLATHPLPVPRDRSQLMRAGLSDRSFRIESDQPIAAYMFNPLQRYDAADAFVVATSDTSLLIPATALGTEYLALTYRDYGVQSNPPFVAVIATADDTEVEVIATETIKLDTFPLLITEGEPTTIMLAKGQVLNLEALSAPGIWRDLSGTRVRSKNHPLAVFSGNRCARVPDSGYYCDHLETQLPPLETWGTRFVVTKFTDRGGEPDYVRVLAQADGTVLELDPPRAAPVLAAGEVWELETRGDFTLLASKPVLVAQFMASQSVTKPPGPFGRSPGCDPQYGGTCLGDPSMLLVAPVGQWRTDPIFLVPDTYRHQFLNVAFSAGTAVRIGGVALDTSEARQVGQGDWRVVTVPVASGVREVVASAAVGVVVYGYDHNISYAYQAGLDFKPLWAVAPN